MSTKNLVLNAAHPDERVSAGPVVNISAKTERYARKHGLLGSLRVMKSLLLLGGALIKSIDIDLVQDPEIADSFLICFSVDAVACVSDVLEFDRSLQDSIF